MKQDYKHPITPPPELVQQWASEWMQQQSLNRDNFMAARASQYGADQELEACCEWLKLEGHEYEHEALLVARRPKPPSLKEQALVALQALQQRITDPNIIEPLRRALESLSDD
jgi:hypothetical protein